MGGQTGIWRRSCLFQFPSCLPPPQVASPGCGRKFRQLRTSSRVCLGYQPQVIRRAVDLLVTSHGPWAGPLPSVPCGGVHGQTGPHFSRHCSGGCFQSLAPGWVPKLSSWGAVLGFSHICHPVAGFAPSPPVPAVT